MERNIEDEELVGYSSSSTSFSSSSHLEIDIGEYDTTLSESPTVIIASPLAPEVSLSPKQSPPIQVMGDDPSRNPSPVFGRRRGSDSEWSFGSNESLFSIHMGNTSFSMENGLYQSKSGEFNWLDDEVMNYSCYTPDDSSRSPVLQTVTETAESQPTDRESGEKEAFVETQNDANHNSTNIACLSDASCQSDSSFAFPILAGGSPSSSPTKVEAEKPQSAPLTPPAEAAQSTPKASTTSKTGGNQWFHCFSCFPICC